MVDELTDARRVAPPCVAPERDMLEAWLDWHRVTLWLKCEGLDGAGLKARPVPSSKLSLHGLVRHLAEVERNWFTRVLCRRSETPSIWWDPAVDPDSELVPLDDADWDVDLATWQAECESSRRTVAGYGLDDTGLRGETEISLRWIYVHMIEEYARHNGHADLLREMVDGAVGE